MKKDILLIPLTYYYGLDSLFAFIKIETTCFMSKGLEQRNQTLFFIVVQRYLKVDMSALVCKAMRVLLAPLFFEFLYLPVCLLKSNFVILFDAKQSWSKAIQFNSTEFEDEVGWHCPFLSCLYNT